MVLGERSPGRVGNRRDYLSRPTRGGFFMYAIVPSWQARYIEKINSSSLNVDVIVTIMNKPHIQLMPAIFNHSG
jgi:hypothetical protein